MPVCHIDSTKFFLCSGTETLKAFPLFLVLSSTMSARTRLDPVELFICFFIRSRVNDGLQLAIYKYVFLTFLWGTLGSGPLSTVGVGGRFWAGEGRDLVLGAATGGVILGGVTTLCFALPSPVIRGNLGASVGGVSVVNGFRSLFNSDSLCESLGIVHCSMTGHL